MPNKSDSERLASIETLVQSIDKRLFGNGQPGEIDHLHLRISGQGREIQNLQRWRYWIMGLAIGAGLFAGSVGHKLIANILP